MKHARVYVLHIEEAITDILSYSKQGKDWFFSSKMGQQAIIRNFEIIGEAAGRIDEGYKSEHPAVPWRELKDFRNHLIHEYFNIDLDIVWDVIENRLPSLVEHIQNLCKES